MSANDKNRPRCTTITPIVPVRDMDRAVKFYTEILGFSAARDGDSYAYLTWDDTAIRLLAATGEESPPEQSCYICVRNLDELYLRLKPKLDTLPKGRVRAPFDQPYGQREFHVIDEDSLLIFFGEPLPGFSPGGE